MAQCSVQYLYSLWSGLLDHLNARNSNWGLIKLNNTMKCVLIPLMEETAEYSYDTVLWFLSLTADKAVEQRLGVLLSLSTCTLDRGLVLTPAVRWRSTLYMLSWCCRWTSRETPSRVEDRAEILAVSGCRWPSCSRSDLAAVSVSDLCNICTHRHRCLSTRSSSSSPSRRGPLRRSTVTSSDSISSLYQRVGSGYRRGFGPTIAKIDITC